MTRKEAAGQDGRLTGGERRVLRAGELTDEEIAVIAKAEVPAGHAHLDEEIEGGPQS